MCNRITIVKRPVSTAGSFTADNHLGTVSYTHLDSDPASRKAAIEFDLEVLRHCAGLVVCGSTISAGMQEEIDFAKENKIAIWLYNGNSIFAF